MRWRVIRSENQNGSSELKHYGVLGMRWGVRKDDYDEDYVAQAAYAKHAGFLTEDKAMRWLESKQGDDTAGFLQAPENWVEASYFDTIGKEAAFDVSDWNSLSDRERGAADDYTTTVGCKLMNGLLRGVLSEDDIASEYNPNTVTAVNTSIDMFSDMMARNPTKKNILGSRKSNGEGIAGLLGISQSDLTNKNVLQSLLGSRVNDPGYFSTTLVAGASNVGEGYGDIDIVVNIPKGSQAMYMEPVTGMDSYQRNMFEVTCQRDSTFQVDGIELDSNGRITALLLDLIGQG